MMIPYGRQSIDEDDIDAVLEVLQSDFLTQGPKVPEFEEAVANYCHAQYGVAANSATSALHIAVKALELKAGEWLWTSPNTFVASANCGLYCGAQIDFVDIDPLTYNLSAVELEKKLKAAKQQNRLPKVVVAVHFAGQSCDMKTIYRLSQEYGFKIVEDASHAIGGKYLERPIGGCQYSDITVFSFHPVKIITTAEGGLATTNSPELADKMRLLRSHGVTRDKHLMDASEHTEGGWYYQQVDLGFNYRMTEMQAALGLTQLCHLDDFVEQRHRLAKHYNQQLSDLPLTVPYQDQSSYSAYHLYPIVVDKSVDRKALFEFLRDREIGVNVHYIPVHTQPYYRELGFRQGDYPNSETYYEGALSLPLHPKLTEQQQSFVIESIKAFLQ